MHAKQLSSSLCVCVPVHAFLSMHVYTNICNSTVRSAYAWAQRECASVCVCERTAWWSNVRYRYAHCIADLMPHLFVQFVLFIFLDNSVFTSFHMLWKPNALIAHSSQPNNTFEGKNKSRRTLIPIRIQIESYFWGTRAQHPSLFERRGFFLFSWISEWNCWFDGFFPCENIRNTHLPVAAIFVLESL